VKLLPCLLQCDITSGQAITEDGLKMHMERSNPGNIWFNAYKIRQEKLRILRKAIFTSMFLVPFLISARILSLRLCATLMQCVCSII
jgi:hypothetical protein